jgi:hypothetical protein
MRGIHVPLNPRLDVRRSDPWATAAYADIGQFPLLYQAVDGAGRYSAHRPARLFQGQQQRHTHADSPKSIEQVSQCLTRQTFIGEKITNTFVLCQLFEQTYLFSIHKRLYPLLIRKHKTSLFSLICDY